jgi:SAM-dependent methyltransferase
MGGVIRMQDLPDAEKKVLPIEAVSFNTKGERIQTLKLHDVLPSGSWKGRRCFILGGGQSLKGFDFSQLKGELVIACNRAFESCPNAAVMIAQDARLWGWYEGGDLGMEAREKFRAFKGFKSWVNCQAFPYPEDLYIIDTTHVRDFNWDKYNYSGGIPWCTNTGLDALCLAVCLGANPIYLLGFDCYGKDGKTANFHEGYPDHNDEIIYKENMVPNFNDFSPYINAVTKVINLNPKSEIKCFEFGELPKKISRPLITGCYTINTKYEEEIKRLEKSLIKFGLEYYFEGITNTGDWRKNVHEKVKFIRRVMDKFDRDIIQMDSDCEVLKFPEMFDKLSDYDVACHIMPREVYTDKGERKEITDLTNVSVVYLKNCTKVKKMLDSWVERDSTLEDHIDDISFAKNLKEFPKLKVLKLPLSYCHIFDRPTDDSGEPVIDLYQANRRLRDTVALPVMANKDEAIKDEAIKDEAIKDEAEKVEKELYTKLWQGEYIPSQCALPLVAYIAKRSGKEETMLDFGCGDGSTVQMLRSMGYLNCLGLDITKAGIRITKMTDSVNRPLYKWFIEKPIWDSGLEDNAIDYTFSTDVLEHLPPEKVDDAIKEILRVTGKRTFHCIALFSDERNGVELHKTRKPISWWKDKFNQFNTKGVKVELIDRVEFLGLHKMGVL